MRYRIFWNVLGVFVIVAFLFEANYWAAAYAAFALYFSGSIIADERRIRELRDENLAIRFYIAKRQRHGECMNFQFSDTRPEE